MLPLESNTRRRKETAVTHGAVGGKTWARGRWQRRGRLIALVACDQLAILSTVVLSSLALGFFFSEVRWPGWLRLFTVVSPAALLAFSTHDLYRTSRDEPGLELRRITLASCTLFGLLLLVSLIDGKVGTWSEALLVSWFLCLFLVPSWRALGRRLRSQ